VGSAYVRACVVNVACWASAHDQPYQAKMVACCTLALQRQPLAGVQGDDVSVGAWSGDFCQPVLCGSVEMTQTV
jgi:hypothetical protein